MWPQLHPSKTLQHYRNIALWFTTEDEMGCAVEALTVCWSSFKWALHGGFAQEGGFAWEGRFCTGRFLCVEDLHRDVLHGGYALGGVCTRGFCLEVLHRFLRFLHRLGAVFEWGGCYPQLRVNFASYSINLCQCQVVNVCSGEKSIKNITKDQTVIVYVPW